MYTLNESDVVCQSPCFFVRCLTSIMAFFSQFIFGFFNDYRSQLLSSWTRVNIKIVQNNELVTFSQCMAITLDEEGGGIYSIKCALQAKNPILTHIKFRISLSTNLLTNYFDDLFSARPSHNVRFSMVFPSIS